MVAAIQTARSKRNITMKLIGPAVLFAQTALM